MAFTDTQVQALSHNLSARHVRTRQANGRTLSYIEGWHVIAEANRIFGFDAWDRLGGDLAGEVQLRLCRPGAGQGAGWERRDLPRGLWLGSWPGQYPRRGP